MPAICRSVAGWPGSAHDKAAWPTDELTIRRPGSVGTHYAITRKVDLVASIELFGFGRRSENKEPWLVASLMRSRSPSPGVENRPLAPQKANAITATIATPKATTVIANGSCAGSLNIASISKPRSPQAEKQRASLGEKFVSANIGRSKRLALCRAKRCAAGNRHRR
jgi:hypothetical protein